jgi:hypothetical protein
MAMKAVMNTAMTPMPIQAGPRWYQRLRGGCGGSSGSLVKG